MSGGYWEACFDKWLVKCQKDLAFFKLTRDRESFAPEREVEFNRRAAESEREAAIYPPAVPETESGETGHGGQIGRTGNEGRAAGEMS